MQHIGYNLIKPQNAFTSYVYQDALSCDSEGTFPSSSQAAQPSAARRGGFTMFLFIAKREAGKIVDNNFYSVWFELTGSRTQVYSLGSERSSCNN